MTMKGETPSPLVLKWGRFSSPGDICQCLKTFSLVTTWKAGATGTYWVKDKDAVICPAMCRTAAPPTRTPRQPARMIRPKTSGRGAVHRPDFTVRGTKAQNGEVTCARSPAAFWCAHLGSGHIKKTRCFIPGISFPGTTFQFLLLSSSLLSRQFWK